jgi:hypothetical protein
MMEQWTATFAPWWLAANASDAPLLPTLAAQQVWMHAAWALVLAWATAALLHRWTAKPWVPWGAAGAVAMWACMQGAYAPSYWLGLAFQAPSLTTAGLCVVALLRLAGRYERPGAYKQSSPARGGVGVWVAMGIAAGWLLLLDTFALLPGVQLYAWGFGPVAPAVLLLVAALPWVMSGTRAIVWLGAVALAAIFMGLHLPSGNAWDAVIDPWLWAALHVWAWRLVRQR